MQKYWLDINGQNERFWEVWTPVIRDNSQQLPDIHPEPVDQRTKGGFRSTLHTVCLAHRPLKLIYYVSQYTPAISCKGHTINQISWYFYTRGSVLDGNWEMIGERNNPYTLWSTALMGDNRCPDQRFVSLERTPVSSKVIGRDAVSHGPVCKCPPRHYPAFLRSREFH